MDTTNQWRCPKCGEPVPGDFDVFWSCGTDRLGVPDPAFEPAVGFTPQYDSCGYLLFGLPTCICPECGCAFDPSKKDTIRDVGPPS